MRTILNGVWLLFGGLGLAVADVVAHLVVAVLLAVTIIGIPFAVATLRMLPLAVAPYGKDVIDLRTARPAEIPSCLHRVERPAADADTP